MGKMKVMLLAVLLCFAVSFGADGTCRKFTVWNPNTNDTLYHFFRGKGQRGDCVYDYHMIGHRVKWHCHGLTMVHRSDTTAVNDTRGEISLNPFTYYCESIF